MLLDMTEYRYSCQRQPSARLTPPSPVNPRLAPRPSSGMMIATPIVNAKGNAMLAKVGRLFVIKTRFEAFLIIYALALGAVERGQAYLTQFPGLGGKLLFLACTGAVFLAGAKMLDCIRHEREAKAREAAEA